MELSAILLVLGVASAVPITLAGMFHLLVFVFDAMSCVKLEKNILMTSLIQDIEARKIRTLYISTNLVYLNFNITERIKTTTYKYSDGSTSSTNQVGYLCHITPANAIDFNKLGYQSIPKRHLRQYKRQLIRKLHSIPQVANVESHRNLTFDYGFSTQLEQPKYEEIWIINYQYVANNTHQTNGGKIIG